MESIITLNGKAYVEKETAEAWIKEAEARVKEEEKETKPRKKNNMTLHNSMIVEKCNVMGIVPLGRDELKDSFVLDFPDDNQKWKLVSEELIKPQVKGFSTDFETYIISNTKYSKEFIDIAKKTSKAFGYGRKPEIFLMCEEKDEKDEFKENNPCLIIFERRLAFVLAPRVESE